MATLDQDGLLDLVGDIYDAALRPQGWQPLIERLSTALGGAMIHMPLIDASHQVERVIAQINTDPEADSRFRSSTAYTDPATNPWIAALHAAPPGTLLLRESVQDDACFRRTPMYNDILRPQGVWHWAFGPLVRDSNIFIPWGILRSPRAASINGHDLGFLHKLVPHLRRGLQVALRLDAFNSPATAIGELIDDLPAGIVLVDGDGQALRLNRMAEAIVAEADGLRILGGRLAAATPDNTARLRKLIGAAARTSRGGGLDAGGTLALSRPSQARPLAVLVAPLRGERAPFVAAQARAIVMISDPGRRRRLPRDTLARLYNLSARQAELATLLADGRDLGAAADALAMSRNTARSHLRAIFAKTGTHRQAELAKLMARQPGL